MELADLAYRGGNTAETKRIIAHEVGHGIAGEKLHVAGIAHAESVIELNQKADATTDSFNRLSAANTDLQAAIDAYNQKNDDYNKEKNPAQKAILKQQKDQLYADYQAKKAISDKLLKENKADAAAEKAARATSTTKEAAAQALRISKTQFAAIKANADNAKATHDARLSTGKKSADKIDKSDAAVQTYYDAVLQASTDLVSFYTDTKAQNKSEADVVALIKGANQTIEKRNNSRSALVSGKKGADMITAFANLETAQDAFFEAAKSHSLAQNRNKKVQEFVTFVEANHIAPLTPYAADNWPHKPEEFYAEAYSFWVTGKLKAVSSVLNQWFDDGKYK